METVYVVGGVIALAIICLTIIIGLAIKYMPKDTYTKDRRPEPADLHYNPNHDKEN